MNNFKDGPTLLQNNSFQKRDLTNLPKATNSKPTGATKENTTKSPTQNYQRLLI